MENSSSWYFGDNIFFNFSLFLNCLLSNWEKKQKKNREKNVKRFSRVQESNPALPSSFLLYIHLFIFHGYKIFVCYAINIICNVSNHTYIFDIMILYQCIEIISILPFNLNLIIFDALMCTIVYEIYWYFFQVEYAHI